VTLPPELERFATAGSLLRRAASAALNTSFEAAEAEEEGSFTIEQIHRQISDLIDEPV
jgi:hypothetical protein